MVEFRYQRLKKKTKEMDRSLNFDKSSEQLNRWSRYTCLDYLVAHYITAIRQQKWKSIKI